MTTERSVEKMVGHGLAIIMIFNARVMLLIQKTNKTFWNL